MKPVFKLSRLSVVALGMLFGTVSAQPVETQKPDTQIETVKLKLKQTLNIDAKSISASPVDGFYQVFTDRGLLYVSKDGKQLLHGKVYGIEGTVSDLTEQAYSTIRQQAMSELGDSALVFKAEDEKYQVSVFTDITCGYCRKMHSEMQQFNDLGITVKYYAYPRGGLNSDSSRDLDIIWCNEKPEQAMTEAKASGRVSGQACVTSPVTNHFKAGASFGVNSTPALVFEDGSLIPGYQRPEQLLALLQSKGL